VAGYGDGRAFLYRDDSGIIDLGPGRAYGINNGGTVVGETWIVPGHPPAFVYRNGQMQILSDDVFSEPALYDINEDGVAVGSGFVGATQTALLWTEEEQLLDLNVLLPEKSGIVLGSASAINEKGQITGHAFNGQLVAYRLDPLPKLKVLLNGTSIVVSWTSIWSNVVLQAADGLPNTNWQAIATTGTNLVSVPVTNTARFFRVVRPSTE